MLMRWTRPVVLWRSAPERNHRDQVTVWRLGLENQVFYLLDILSPKIQDNPETSMVLRFRIILNVTVRVTPGDIST